MPHSTHLPALFPVGSKYVVETCGSVIRRYVEFPGGRRVSLAARKLPPRGYVGSQMDFVPEEHDTVSFQRRIFA